MPDFSGQSVVVTGGSRGIGQAAALAFARAGANIASFHLSDPDNAAETLAGIAAAGGKAIFVEGDVADAAAVEAFAQRVAAEWGGIDVWVNNAARLLVRPFLEMTIEDWHSLLGSNLHGYFYGCRAALQVMVAQRRGRIVNVASISDIQPIANLSAYVTAKGGVVGLTRTLALEFGPLGININAIAPGATDTPLNKEAYTPAVRKAYCDRIALGRLADPSDIADAILFLASDAARYMCGHELVVDGGFVLNGNVGHAVSD